MKQHAATWLGDICIALLFTMLAWWLRQMGYPLCPGDEAVWLQISRTLDAGQTWPVSGPGFMLAVQTLGEQLGRPTTEAIGLWGIGSVFGAVLVMLRVYRQLEPLRPWVICTSLAMSTYFLARFEAQNSCHTWPRAVEFPIRSLVRGAKRQTLEPR